MKKKFHLFYFIVKKSELKENRCNFLKITKSMGYLFHIIMFTGISKGTIKIFLLVVNKIILF